MKRLEPVIEGNRYIVRFRNPLQDGKVNVRSLGLDENLARSVCRDALLLFNNPEILQAPTREKLVGYEPKSIALVFGEEKAKELIDPTTSLQATLTDDDVEEIRRIVESYHDDVKALKILGQEGGGEAVISLGALMSPDSFEQEGLKNLLRHFTPKNFNLVVTLCRKLQREIVTLQEKNLRLETDIAEYRKQDTRRIKATVAEASASFFKNYLDKKAKLTKTQNTKYIQDFISSLEGKGLTRLVNVEAQDVDKWIDAQTRVKVVSNHDGIETDIASPLHPRTLRKRRNAISKFFSWCKSKYKLQHNPVRDCNPIEWGADTPPSKIRAIDRLTEIQSMLKALDSETYWKAWVAFAILSGPRFSEQCSVKISDVFLDGDGDYIKIQGFKTKGKNKVSDERKVTIEKTTLKPILKEFIQQRLAEQKDPKATAAQKSEWLFPTVALQTNHERKVSQIGQWSHNANFLYNWTKFVARAGNPTAKAAANHWLDERRVERAAAKREKRKPTKLKFWKSENVWSYGPREWRHTFGTVLAHCGFSGLEISKQMGNSPDIALEYYVSGVSSGPENRWPFKY